jgi:hypothetical protein
MIDSVAEARRKLKTLAGAKASGDLLLSVIVSTSRLDEWRQSAPVFLRSEFQRVVAKLGLSKDKRRSLQPALDYVMDLLKYEIKPQTQGMAVYADGAAGFRERIELPCRLMNRLTLEPSPYVRPVVQALHLLQPFVLARVSRDESSLFLVDEWGIASEDDLPGPWLRSSNRETGELSIKEYYAAARQDALVELHFKEVAGSLNKLLELSGVRRVVLCAQHDIAAAFRRTLAASVIGTITAEISFDAAASVGQMVMGARKAAERAGRQALVALAGRINEGLNPGGHGISGFDDVQGALQRGQLQILLADRDYAPSGWLCPHCSWAGLGSVERCPACGGSPMPIVDAVNELVRLALLANCDLEVGRDVPGLDKLGGVAGLLRYA